MKKIALNLIIKNEEKFLEGCLNSVKDLVDEIIIADTGSTDNSIEIAKSFSATILFFDWINDFSAARNYVLQNTDADWILYLDADERIDIKYHKQIRNLVNSEKGDAFLLNLRSPIMSNGVEQVQIVPYPRLFKKIKGIKFTGRIHEQITPSLAAHDAKFVNTNIIIEHLGYFQDEKIIEEKKNRNLKSLKQLVKEEPENSYAHFQLGQNLIMMDKIEQGISHLEKALELKTLTKIVSASCYAILAQSYFKKNDLDKALELCKISLNSAPNQLYGKLLLSEILNRMLKLEESIQILRECFDIIKIPENERKRDIAIDLTYTSEFIYYKIGVVQIQQRKLALAEESFKKSIKLNPNFGESYIELGNIYFQKGSFEESINFLNKVTIAKINNVQLLMNLSGLYFEMQEFAECIRILNRVIIIDPNNPKALFFLGVCYMNLNSFSESEKYLIQSYQIASDIEETLINLAVVYIKTNNYEKALEQYEKLHQIAPEKEDYKKKMTALKYKVQLKN